MANSSSYQSGGRFSSPTAPVSPPPADHHYHTRYRMNYISQFGERKDSAPSESPATRLKEVRIMVGEKSLTTEKTTAIATGKKAQKVQRGQNDLRNYPAKSDSRPFFWIVPKLFLLALMLYPMMTAFAKIKELKEQLRPKDLAISSLSIDNEFLKNQLHGCSLHRRICEGENVEASEFVFPSPLRAKTVEVETTKEESLLTYDRLTTKLAKFFENFKPEEKPEEVPQDTSEDTSEATSDEISAESEESASLMADPELSLQVPFEPTMDAAEVEILTATEQTARPGELPVQRTYDESITVDTVKATII